MPRERDGGLEFALGGDDDEIIEMGSSRVAPRPQNTSRSSDRHGRTGSIPQHVYGLVFPSPVPLHSHSHSHTHPDGTRPGHSRRTPQNLPPPSRSSRQDPQQQQDHTPVIDLTEVPDSPPEREQQIRNGRNPRRTNSQRISPPRLSRSDSTSVGQDVGVIDLTADSPEAVRSSSNVDDIRDRPRRRPAPIFPDELIQLELFARAPQLTTRITNIFTGILGGRHVNMTRNFEPVRPPSPKPPLEPVPPTQEGFTRDTCTNPDEDVAVICPCCNEELAYDPNETVTTSTGSRKRKRAPGDHHFWALKKCGHVYCAECFENRRPSKSSPLGAGFRIPPGKSTTPSNIDIRCVVEGCESKAANKTEWVGIFL